MRQKFYIAVDCEGVACAVGSPGEALGKGENYAFACLQATREADAAAKALFDGGATEVVVWDAHGSGVNLHYDLLDSRCKILLGSGDNACIAEAAALLPKIATVTTKTALSWTSAISKQPAAVCEQIYSVVAKALADLPQLQPYQLPSPLPVEIRYKRMEDATRANLVDWQGNAFSMVDGFTRAGVVASVTDLF